MQGGREPLPTRIKETPAWEFEMEAESFLCPDIEWGPLKSRTRSIECPTPSVANSGDYAGYATAVMLLRTLMGSYTSRMGFSHDVTRRVEAYGIPLGWA